MSAEPISIRDSFRAILLELVMLKDLHDRIERLEKEGGLAALSVEGMKADYARRKPLAWEAARKALGIEK